MQFVLLVEMPLSTDLAIFCVPEELVESLHSSKPMQTQTCYRPMGKTSKSKDIALEELFFLRSKTAEGHLCLLPIAQDEKPFEYGPTTYKRLVQFNSQGLNKFRTAAPKSNTLVSYLQGKSATVNWDWTGFTLEQSAEMWTQIGVQKVKKQARKPKKCVEASSVQDNLLEDADSCVAPLVLEENNEFVQDQENPDLVQKVKQLETIVQLADEGLKQINLVLQGYVPHNTSEKVERLKKA